MRNWMGREVAGLCWFAGLVGVVSAAACGPGAVDEPAPVFEAVVQSPRAALLSVHGTAHDDVWVAGTDDGEGPVVLHWDGEAWQRRASGVRGDLWWVQALPDGTAFFGGSEGHVLRYRDGDFERLKTPGLGRHTVFGVWARAHDDVYAVGAESGRNGFLWHYDGERFEQVELPVGILPEDSQHNTPGLFKIWGDPAGTLWLVGDRGVLLRGDPEAGFSRIESGTERALFTVHGNGDAVTVVGGDNAGTLLRARVDAGTAVDETPDLAALLQGVWVTPQGTAWATGMGGDIYRSEDGGAFEYLAHEVPFERFDSLHAVWVDPKGGVWSVGGNVLTAPLDRGQVVHSGAPVAHFELSYPDTMLQPSCPAEQVDPAPTRSIARRWNEQLLNAIRRAIPRPTEHARNLYHLALATWDAHAAYDAELGGIVVDESHAADDAAQAEAMSYAAYRLLSHRFRDASGAQISQACFDAFMAELGLDTGETGASGDSPRAVGNRIGAALIEHFADDGANEAGVYADPEGWAPDQPKLVVAESGTATEMPTQWQQLVLAKAVTQNGIPEGSGSRGYIGAHWGGVEPFALPEGATDVGGELDIGSPPLSLDAALVDAVMDVLRHGAEVDVDDGVMLDISPGAYGNSSLGSNDGTGYALNPSTGKPYAPQPVLRGDFARVMAEFWADGPTSETPPGHWNTLANQLADRDDFERRLFGRGASMSPLLWDLHAYLVLNGALHDAAIAAWGLKRTYTTARPITLIRYMGGLGQRSDEDGPAYHPEGLPLEPGLVEVVTEDSSAPGQRHAHLARYLGRVAVRAWRGEPGDRDRDIGGVGWMLAVDWMPYQRRTFVTPAFPGYISGHSTFSRAAAEVLAQLTGSPYFPGGLGTFAIDPGYLVFEYGPREPLTLQWATYYDAADQAGRSRLWGGIHVRHDDLDGRRVGAAVGQLAVAHARELFGLPATDG